MLPQKRTSRTKSRHSRLVYGSANLRLAFNMPCVPGAWVYPVSLKLHINTHSTILPPLGNLSKIALVVQSFNTPLHTRCSPSPPLAKESSPVGRALTPHRLLPRWLHPGHTVVTTKPYMIFYKFPCFFGLNLQQPQFDQTPTCDGTFSDGYCSNV